MRLGELFEDNECCEGDLEGRLAFREFGTCLGIGCHPDMTEYVEHSELVLSQWEGHMSQTPKDLKAITWVMYAAALIPGGEYLVFASPYLTISYQPYFPTGQAPLEEIVQVRICFTRLILFLQPSVQAIYRAEKSQRCSYGSTHVVEALCFKPALYRCLLLSGIACSCRHWAIRSGVI